MAKKIEYDNINQLNADIALKNRLYVSGFRLSGVLKRIRSGLSPQALVVIHYEKDIPVGVAIHNPLGGYQVQVFVRKACRNRGIGTKLIEALNPPKNSYVGTGSKYSLNFWIKNDFLM